MIFGLGAAAIFYVTTGQFYHDIKPALVKNICCSHSGPNHGFEKLSEESHLILEQGGAMSELSESSAIAKERKQVYGS
jgi:hypothetical protein